MDDITQKLGPEIADANFLSISEVDLLLTHYKEQGESNHLFDKIHCYVKRFNRFPSKEVTKTLRDLLKTHEFSNEERLNDLQIVLLINLCPESPSEAKALIPDLTAFSDEELGLILDDMARLKHMQQQKELSDAVLYNTLMHQQARNLHKRYIELAEKFKIQVIPQLSVMQDPLRLAQDELELCIDKITKTEFNYYCAIIEHLSQTNSVKLWGSDFERSFMAKAGRVRKSTVSTGFQKPPSQSPQAHQRLLKALSVSVSHSFTLTELVLLGFKLSLEGLKTLSNGIKKCPTIQRLAFNECSLGETELACLLPVINACKSLSALNLSFNNLGPESGSLISSIVGKQAEKRDSAVWANTLRGEQAVRSQGLVDIMLRGNRLGDEGFSRILTALHSDSWLKLIDVRDNGITRSSMKKAPRVIRENGSLLILDIRGNPCADQYLSHLVNILTENIANYTEGSALGSYEKWYEAIINDLEPEPSFTLKSLAVKKGANVAATRPDENAEHEGCCDLCRHKIAGLRRKCEDLARKNAELRNRQKDSRSFIANSSMDP